MFWMVVLCAPGAVTAVIFYRRHCKERPGGENRFPLGLYVVALLICAFVAFWVNDRSRFSGRPSLTGHCGHGPTCSLPGPVANDPYQPFGAVN